MAGWAVAGWAVGEMAMGGGGMGGDGGGERGGGEGGGGERRVVAMEGAARVEEAMAAAAAARGRWWHKAKMMIGWHSGQDDD